MIETIRYLFISLITLFFLIALPFNTQAQDSTSLVPQTWKMLDYMSADYADAVSNDGNIINESEYAEMREFSETAHQHIESLPDRPGKTQILAAAEQLVTLIKNKAAHTAVADQANKVNAALLSVYPMPTAPEQLPDLAAGASLYQTHCAACHGVTGEGNGPDAVGLDPLPVNFTGIERANLRSPLSYYQTITQGVDDTSMLGYEKQFSELDRWALAYYVGTLAYQKDTDAGTDLWQNSRTARAQISNLDELSRASVNQIASVIGQPKARQLIGYLRTNPEELKRALTGIALARGRLKASVTAYQADDHKSAIQLALSSYLDGVEPVEPQLNVNNSSLRAKIELAMGAYRTSLSKNVDMASIQSQADKLDRLLSEAQTLTSNTANNPSTIFIGAFTILLREGLEALLVVVGIIAFLKKAERHESLPYVHAGWLLAMVAGGLTWFVAHYFISISGASRELTEGIGSLFAVVVLLGVGLWMHQKSIGDRWQLYIQEKMSHALSKKSAWLLFVLAFVTVYREMFETILFYIALWNEGQGQWMLAGIVSAIVALALFTWILLGTSKYLPIATFFSVSSVLVALLAFVMTGKGISALQEAGWVGVSIAPLPHIGVLGIFPTWQTSLAQGTVILLLIAGYLYNKRFSSAA